MYIKQLDDGTVELTAPVMIPGAKDCDFKNGEKPLTKQQISQFAKTYEKYQFIDHEHGLTRNGVRIGEPINSFLLTEDTTLDTLDGSKTYPKGTWMVTSHITDDTAIQNALSGGYTGYSASVFTQSRADEYLAALKSNPDTELPCSCKDINSTGNSLIKDVPNPVVLSVSLVKSPCLHDSKFCELDGDNMTDEVQSFKSKILKAMDLTELAEVEALKSEVVSLEAKIDEMQTQFNEALKSMQEAFESSLKEALTPVAEKAEEEDVEVEEVEEETPVEETTTEEADVEEATEEETVEEEPEEETEPVAEKGHSKSEPVHDNIEAQKSKPMNIYEALGRNPDGTRKL